MDMAAIPVFALEKEAVVKEMQVQSKQWSSILPRRDTVWLKLLFVHAFPNPHVNR